MTDTWGQWLRLALVAAVWPVIYFMLARYGVDLLPLSFAHQLDLEEYLALVQITAALIGTALCFAVCVRPRAVLGFSLPATRGIVLSFVLAPVVYVAASAIAIEVALPTLLAELQKGGTQLAQKSTGELGKTLVAAPAVLVLLWGAVISPIAEELMFRGAIWSSVQGLVERLVPAKSDAPQSLSPELISEGAFVKGTRAVGRFLVAGGIATVVTAAIFAWMHADKPGGLGIVRVVSALGLGIACGLARQGAGSLSVPILLHVCFNALSIATTRRWVVTATFPIKRGVPTLLELCAAIALVVGIAAAWVLRPRRDPPT